MVLVDCLLIAGGYFLSYLLRFEGQIYANEMRIFAKTLPYILLLKLFIFFIFGLYRGMWRYTGLVDVLTVLKASVISSLAIILGILFIYRFQGFSRALFVIDGMLTFVFISGIRLSLRVILLEKGLRFFSFNKSSKQWFNGKKRLLIIGAGDAGEKILREIYDNPRLEYQVVGFLDDDLNKRGMRIHGVPVLGPLEILNILAQEGVIDEILIAIPSASARKMRKIIEACEATGLRFRTKPGIGELINGRISFKMIREVSYEDLLGREEVPIDIKSIGHYLEDKVILVTGAGGSIGADLCRQISSFHPKNPFFLDRAENSLFHIEMEFRQRFPKIFINPILGDVYNRGFLEKLFAMHRPQVVFHAAAFKHVPIVELNPWESVFNNVIGTRNLVEASCQSMVERFVTISTDKAVRPGSVMGATKRVAEMITACYGKHYNANLNGGRFVSVRFGNVIGSEGSVIHLFKKQIERFGPVTVTHPEITRYFMTISEACKLILQAGAMGEGGEIFILDMGTPIKILEMARDLIRGSGFKPDVDIEIKFIGLRPGEKLHEELINQGEGIIRSSHEKIFVLKGENNYSFTWLNQKIEELVNLALQQDATGIKSKLREIVPEYQPYDLSNYRSIRGNQAPV
jgi:FlaA1/EpsC-like NDP-sugar epimerase